MTGITKDDCDDKRGLEMTRDEYGRLGMTFKTRYD